ncbi:hypothetical protein VNI00_009106 [Paramarasmius palmivorus]|uniref:Uncharacterized protein n=1 Tax=Paramarasmius palmivorus TaxID=297713 RepID=A0AAW0CPF3_9AGAR
MPILIPDTTEQSQAPEAPSTMTILGGSSNFTITGSQLNNIVGPQHNTIYHGNVTVQQVNRDFSEHQLTLWDEFTRIRTCDVYIKQNLCVTDIGKDPEQRKLTKGRLKAYRTIKTAHLTNKKLDVLYVGYGGEDAVKAFQKDFREYSCMKRVISVSNVKDANYVQLLGYTSKPGVPALIFYDGLIPVSFVWEKHGFSSLMFTYISYLARQIEDPDLLVQELWIDPMTGSLRKGPYVENFAHNNYVTARFQTGLLLRHSDNQPSLALQEYNNTDVLQEYLFRFLSIDDNISGARRSAKYTPEWANDEDTVSILSSLPGTIYSRASLEPIARWLGDEESWYYTLFECHPEISQERVVMKDGSLRPAEQRIDFAETWLSLAHHVFYQLGIHRDEWAEHSIINDFMLYCECEQRKSPQRPTGVPIDTPVYLFIHPIPQPSDDESTWDAWVKGKKYSWSFDPLGNEEISDAENEQWNLGIPLLKIFIRNLHRWWDLEAYDTIQALHTLHAFDPTSVRLARSVGFPYQLVEIINPDSGRFEYISDEEEDLSTAYPDNSESWFAHSDNPIQAPTIHIDEVRDNMDAEGLFVSNFDDSDSMDVDGQLPDAMDID